MRVFAKRSHNIDIKISNMDDQGIHAVSELAVTFCISKGFFKISRVVGAAVTAEKIKENKYNNIEAKHYILALFCICKF